MFVPGVVVAVLELAVPVVVLPLAEPVFVFAFVPVLDAAPVDVGFVEPPVLVEPLVLVAVCPAVEPPFDSMEAEGELVEQAASAPSAPDSEAAIVDCAVLRPRIIGAQQGTRPGQTRTSQMGLADERRLVSRNADNNTNFGCWEKTPTRK